MEILNNAIDHSNGSKAIINNEWISDSVDIVIIDDGIGIFRKIKNALNLED
jgi:signal transduction histidine kinase